MFKIGNRGAGMALGLTCILLFCGAAPVMAGSQGSAPVVVAKTAILEDATTGQILYAKNTHQQMYPASITKIMTAILAIQYGHLNQVVTVQQRDLSDGSSCYLQVGEQITMKNLLYGLLLPSGNDCANAIARTVAGSVPTFVNMMNQKAWRLGARETHFDNPNGMPDPKHLTSVYDMALIARYALTLPYFRQVDGTKVYNFPSNNNKTLTLINQDKLLWNYPGAIGLKIGYTIAAGETMAGAATRGNTTLVVVIMDSTYAAEWPDVTSLLNYGFANFTPTQPVTKGMVLGKLAVSGQAGAKVPMVAKKSFTVLLPSGGQGPALKLTSPKALWAPIKKNQIVGNLLVSYEGQLLGQVPVVAGESTSTPPFPPWEFLTGVGVILFAGLKLSRRPKPTRRGYRERYY